MQYPPVLQEDDIFPFHIIMLLLVIFHQHTSHIETHRYYDKFTPFLLLFKTFQNISKHFKIYFIITVKSERRRGRVPAGVGPLEAWSPMTL